jgi:hypothetical protein
MLDKKCANEMYSTYFNGLFYALELREILQYFNFLGGLEQKKVFFFVCVKLLGLCDLPSILWAYLPSPVPFGFTELPLYQV